MALIFTTVVFVLVWWGCVSFIEFAILDYISDEYRRWSRVAVLGSVVEIGFNCTA